MKVPFAMKGLYTVILSAALLPVTALAQTSSFEKVVAAPLFSIDAIARAAQLAPDQGACVFASNALIGPLGDADILLLRVNGAGDIVQNLTIGDAGGQGYHDVAKEVVQTDKHYYVTGYTRAIDTSALHTFTAFLIKVDTALNFVWQKNYILPGQEIYAEAMTPVGASDLLIAGKTYDGGGSFHSFVMRTDSTGTPLWIQQYQMPLGETIECVRELPGGDILLSGSVIFSFELVLPFVCKLNAAGDFLWGKYYNYPPGFVERSSFQFIRVGSMANIQLAGYTDKFGAGSTDYYIVDIDSSGTVNWARTYGGSQFDEPNMVQYDSQVNELVMVGSSGSFATLGAPYPMVMRVAPSGTLINAALYGDTSVYQPSRFYHSSRVGPDARLLMGSRDAPADDLYLVGADNDLVNGCEVHPVVPAIAPQASGTSSFTANVVPIAPVINDSALAVGSFSNETLLCDQPTALTEPTAPSGLLFFPSPGQGTFQWQLPPSFRATSIRVYDPMGRLVFTQEDGPDVVRLPEGLSAGRYEVRVMDATGRELAGSYELLSR
ncbi:MAG: T9SS type A sorting domain-containing protein [Flavobacteriales bacterium]|nr:T9SS type A sorting domain-containing protein [Flavobacteriales bacterium]MBK9537921.1 T9SS type A sorting domain-containing protein [Flavobacteriales bacterium]